MLKYQFIRSNVRHLTDNQSKIFRNVKDSWLLKFWYWPCLITFRLDQNLLGTEKKYVRRLETSILQCHLCAKHENLNITGQNDYHNLGFIFISCILCVLMFVLVALTVVIYSLLFIVGALTTLNVKVKFLKLFCCYYCV